MGGRGKHACFYTSEYIKTTRDKIKTNEMDLIKIRNIDQILVLIKSISLVFILSRVVLIYSLV